jgi:hypothetical protein
VRGLHPATLSIQAKEGGRNQVVLAD